jgi:HrpA-like helicases
VIDSGLVKQKTHHPGTGLDVLQVTSISQAQAWQRTGRAGREAEGFCYRMYSEEDFRRMNKNTVPEIQRTNLASTALTLLSLEINAATFDFMDKPPKEVSILNK